jgi:hypothetical protein
MFRKMKLNKNREETDSMDTREKYPLTIISSSSYLALQPFVSLGLPPRLSSKVS